MRATHASRKACTFSGVIPAALEKRVPPGSLPYAPQSAMSRPCAAAIPARASVASEVGTMVFTRTMRAAQSSERLWRARVGIEPKRSARFPLGGRALQLDQNQLKGLVAKIFGQVPASGRR